MMEGYLQIEKQVAL